MLTALTKILFVAAAGAASIYSMSIFGPGLWSWVFGGIALAILFSIFVASLDPVAIVLGKISGILSGLALTLLLIAATTGGSFNMSESNEVFAYMLGILSVFGISAFFWDNRAFKKSPDTSVETEEHDGPQE